MLSSILTLFVVFLAPPLGQDTPENLKRLYALADQATQRTLTTQELSAIALDSMASLHYLLIILKKPGHPPTLPMASPPIPPKRQHSLLPEALNALLASRVDLDAIPDRLIVSLYQPYGRFLKDALAIVTPGKSYPVLETLMEAERLTTVSNPISDFLILASPPVDNDAFVEWMCSWSSSPDLTLDALKIFIKDREPTIYDAFVRKLDVLENEAKVKKHNFGRGCKHVELMLMSLLRRDSRLFRYRYRSRLPSVVLDQYEKTIPIKGAYQAYWFRGTREAAFLSWGSYRGSFFPHRGIVPPSRVGLRQRSFTPK